MTDDLLWVHWWHCGSWQHAHCDWRPAALAHVAPHTLEDLARSRHRSLACLHGIAPFYPTVPDATRLALLGGSPTLLTLALKLVAQLCRPLTDQGLPEDVGQWCHRIAKALRPGQWLTDGEDSLILLRAWLTPATWERARLRFARARIEAVEALPLPSITARRLDTLWQTAAWKALELLATPPQEVVDADAAFT